jgi:hypothetical protein
MSITPWVVGVVPDSGPQSHQLLECGQKIRHLILAADLVVVSARRLADLGGVLLGEAARLIEIIAPLLRGYASSCEDGERAGDGRGQWCLISQLLGEIFEEGTQAFPLLALTSNISPAAAAPRGPRDLASLGNQILQARRPGSGFAIGSALQLCESSRPVEHATRLSWLACRFRALLGSFNLVVRPFEIRNNSFSRVSF